MPLLHVCEKFPGPQTSNYDVCASRVELSTDRASMTKESIVMLNPPRRVKHLDMRFFGRRGDLRMTLPDVSSRADRRPRYFPTFASSSANFCSRSFWSWPV